MSGPSRSTFRRAHGRRACCLVAAAAAAVTVATPAQGAPPSDVWALPHAERLNVADAPAPRATVWWRDAQNRLKPAPDASWHPPQHQPLWTPDPALHTWVHVVQLHAHQDPHYGPRVFVLDRGRIDGQPIVPGGPKLVALSPLTGKAVNAWWLDVPGDLTPDADLHRFALDASGQTAYLHDTGTQSLIVLNLRTRRAHAVLQGQVTPDTEIELGQEGWLSLKPASTGVTRRIPTTLLHAPDIDPRVIDHFTQTFAPGASPSASRAVSLVRSQSHREPPQPGHALRASDSTRFGWRSGWWRVTRPAASAKPLDHAKSVAQAWDPDQP